MIEAWQRLHPGIEVTIKTIKTKNGFNTRIWMESERAINYKETTTIDILDDWWLEMTLDEMFEELDKSM